MPTILIIILAGYVAGNAYVFVRGLQALGNMPPTVRLVFGIVYWTCALMMFAVTLLREHITYIPVGRLLHNIGTGWLVFFFYMLVFVACADLARLFIPSFRSGFAVAFVLTAGILTYGFVNNLGVKKTVVRLDVNKPLTNGDRLKIVAISDLHLGLGTSTKQLRKNVDRINAEKPDIILIAGDLIDNSVAPVAANRMDLELKRLHAPMGVYMSPGNHEYISGIDRSREFIAQTGIQLLVDSIVELPCGLTIVGRDDRSSSDRLSAQQLAALTDRRRPTIIIDHQPSEINEAQPLDAFLQFSGHTHNGQIIPIKWIAAALYETSYGLSSTASGSLYVSSGISLWGPPFRIGTDNEFVVFECSFNGK